MVCEAEYDHSLTLYTTEWSQSVMNNSAPKAIKIVTVGPEKEQGRREGCQAEPYKTKFFAYSHRHALSNAPSLQRELSYCYF